MNFIKQVSFFLLTILCCTSYAHENKYIFVGQNGNEGSPAFILELLGSEAEQYCHISDSGEVYLKVDKIVAIPKNSLKLFTQMVTPSSAQNVSLASMQDQNDTERLRCSKCDTEYWATRGNRHCPKCGTYN